MRYVEESPLEIKLASIWNDEVSQLSNDAGSAGNLYIRLACAPCQILSVGHVTLWHLPNFWDLSRKLFNSGLNCVVNAISQADHRLKIIIRFNSSRRRNHPPVDHKIPCLVRICFLQGGLARRIWAAISTHTEWQRWWKKCPSRIWGISRGTTYLTRQTKFQQQSHFKFRSMTYSQVPHIPMLPGTSSTIVQR